jgi:hypothetical protein
VYVWSVAGCEDLVDGENEDELTRRLLEAGDPRAALRQVMRDELLIDDAGAGAVFEGLRRDPLPTGALSVYLDLNHWVSLAKARLGREDGRSFVRCLELLKNAVEEGRAVVPLSATHYAEVGQITSLRRRADLANVMAELSNFTTLAS